MIAVEALAGTALTVFCIACITAVAIVDPDESFRTTAILVIVGAFLFVCAGFLWVHVLGE